jgi:hypothetical protein
MREIYRATEGLLLASQQGHFHEADYQLHKKGYLYELIIRF